MARLIAPNGASHVLFGYTGATGTGRGTSSSLYGAYSFRDSGTANWWTLAALAEFDIIPIVPSGTAYVYRTSQIGGPGSTGAQTLMDPVFAGGPSSGVWTLRLTDGTASSVGAISAASLTIGVSTTPTSIDDQFTTPHATTLAIAAPGVLVNDRENLGGAMTAALVSGPANGVVSLSSRGLRLHPDRLRRHRQVHLSGRHEQRPGNVATVTIVVAQPTTVQPPTDFRVSSLAGNDLTLRWTPPLWHRGHRLRHRRRRGARAGARSHRLASERCPTVTFPARTAPSICACCAWPTVIAAAPQTRFRSSSTPHAAVRPGRARPGSSTATRRLSWRNTFGGAAATSLATRS